MTAEIATIGGRKVERVNPFHARDLSMDFDTLVERAVELEAHSCADLRRHLLTYETEIPPAWEDSWIVFTGEVWDSNAAYISPVSRGQWSSGMIPCSSQFMYDFRLVRFAD